MEPLGDHLGPAPERRPFGQDDELVAAEPPDGVALPEDADEPMGHGLEDLVAGVVAQRVVDVLEVVEVDEQRGHRSVLAPGADEHLVGSVEDQGAVGEAGQRVVQRHVEELGLGLLALGDVAQVADVAGHRRVVAEVAHDRLGVAVGAVGVLDPELDGLGDRHGVDQRGELRLDAGPVLGMDELGGPHAEDVLGVPAEQRERGRARRRGCAPRRP